MIKRFTHKYKSASVELKSSLAYTICNVLQRSISLITLPLFARLLTTEQYGQASVYSSWESLLSIFISLNLGFGSFNTAMVKFEKQRDAYVASVNGICITLALVFLAIYFPFQQSFNRLFELPTFLIIVMVLQIVAANVLQCWTSKMRFEYKYKEVIAVTLLSAVVTPVIMLIFVLNSEERGYARIFGGAIVTIVIGAVLYVYFLFKGKRFFTKEFWKYALSFNLPLIPYYLSQVVFNTSDRIMISNMVGTDKAGIYSMAYTLGTVLVFLLNSVNSSYVPWLYQRIKDGNRKENQKVSTYIALLMAVLLLVVIIATPEIVHIMAGKAYAEAIWVVPPIAMTILFMFYGQLFVNVEFFFEEKEFLVIGMIGSAVVNVVLNFLLIPKIGYIIAAYTTLVSYVLMVAINFFVYRRTMQKRELPDELFCYRDLILILVAFMACGFGITALYNYVWIRYGIVLVVLMTLYLKRHWLLERYRQLRR